MKTGLYSLLGLGLLVAACGSDSPGATCPANTMCGTSPTGTLAIELVPSSSSTDVPQEIAAAMVKFDPSGNATLSLKAPVTLAGAVVDAHGNPIAAQVIATRPSLIPGRPAVVTQAATDDKGEYAMRVVPGMYSVEVLPLAPDNLQYPPVVEQLDLVRDVGNHMVRMPRLGDMPVIVGRVSDALGNGLAHTQVRALDGNGALVSSVAEVGLSGDFVLFLPPRTDPSSQVTLTATPPAPTNSMQTLVPLPVLSRAVPVGTSEPVELRMPALPNLVSVGVPIWGKSPAGTDEKIAGARVDFHTSIALTVDQADTVATYATSAVSDEDGLATLSLIPGDSDGNRSYDVTVTPPSDSVFAANTKPFSVSIAPSTSGGVIQGLQLETRAQVIGQVRAADGGPLKGVVISPQPIDDVPGSAVLPSTISDEMGGFAIRLDRRIYEIDLVPPATAPIARWSFDYKVDGDDTLPAQDTTFPPATMAQIVVSDASGAPASQVEVRVYAVAAQCTSSMDPCTTPAQLRADGVTDASGALSLLLATP